MGDRDSMSALTRFSDALCQRGLEWLSRYFGTCKIAAIVYFTVVVTVRRIFGGINNMILGIKDAEEILFQG